MGSTREAYYSAMFKSTSIFARLTLTSRLGPPIASRYQRAPSRFPPAASRSPFVTRPPPVRTIVPVFGAPTPPVACRQPPGSTKKTELRRHRRSCRTCHPRFQTRGSGLETIRRRSARDRWRVPSLCRRTIRSCRSFRTCPRISPEPLCKKHAVILIAHTKIKRNSPADVPPHPRPPLLPFPSPLLLLLLPLLVRRLNQRRQLQRYHDERGQDERDRRHPALRGDSVEWL